MKKWIIAVIVISLIIMYMSCKKNSNSPASSLGSTFSRIKSRFGGNSEQTSNKNGMIDNINDDNVLIFYAKWCGHCKKSMSEFVKASKQSDSIILIDSDENPDLVAKYNVQGFPCIMKASGEIYSGQRNASSIVAFAES